MSVIWWDNIREIRQIYVTAQQSTNRNIGLGLLDYKWRLYVWTGDGLQAKCQNETIHWHKHIYICMFVVVNFDALAQASDIQIERRQVVFHCWMQDLNPGSQTPNRQQTECPLTNRLSYRGSSLKLQLDSPSLWSASIQPTRPHSQLAFAPGSGDIHVCCC